MLLLLAAVVLAGRLAWNLWGTGIAEARAQGHLRAELTERHTPVEPARVTVPADGHALAILRIPRFGASYDPVVVEGTNAGDLRKGPGHYAGSALPGQVGNFVISGHRTTYGHPFGDLDRLRPGDRVAVEYAGRTFVYRVTGHQVVAPSRVGVTLPVPDRPGLRPTRALLTMTTCTPKYSAAQRLVVRAALEGSTARASSATALAGPSGH